MALTATAQPGNIPPRIYVEVTGLSGTEVTMLRNDPDGRARPVRTAEPGTLTAGGWIGYDYEAPFGEAVTYTAVPTTGSSQTSDAVTLDATDVWLIHPGIPDLSVKVSSWNVGELAERVRPAKSSMLEPLGRVNPVVVSQARGGAQSGLTIATETLDQRNALWALLRDGVPLLFNIPPALEWGLPHQWISVGDVTETPFARGLSTARVFDLPYTMVDRPVGALLAQWTWADVVTGYTSWADVNAKYATWADLLANTPTTS